MDEAHLHGSRPFNPRAREGRDARHRTRRVIFVAFNPRAREGRDDAGRLTVAEYLLSIHAPARGATMFLAF